MFEGRPERPPPRPPRIKSKDMYLDVTPQNNVAEHAAAAAAAAAFAVADPAGLFLCVLVDSFSF